MQPETIFTIVGCGDSARNWIPRGHSIGLNDCWKWGKPTDSLLCCNKPQDFTKDRLQIIHSSRPKTFYSHKSNWAYAFSNWQKISLVSWYGVLNKGMHYSSDTSSFIALTLAWNIGAKDIILWGCDFMNHKIFNPTNPYRDKEVKRHMELIDALKGEGVSVYIGITGTAFDLRLPVWPPQYVSFG